MNIQIYGTNKCFETKKAQRYFKERRIKFQFVDILKYPMSEGEFRNIKQALKLPIKEMINEKSNNPKNKSHMMIVGPSGTGKTEMINIIAKKLNIPFFKADATAYTKEGYVGKSVYSMFNGLIDAANGDVEKAQRGLLIIDEIDKKLSTEKRDDVSAFNQITSKYETVEETFNLENFKKFHHCEYELIKINGELITNLL